MRALSRFWTLGLTSPLIYLAVCLYVNHAVFAHRTVRGFWPLPPSAYHTLLLALAAVACACIPAVYFLKILWARTAREVPDEENSPILGSRRGKRFLALFMICDTVALTGLILFMIQGQLASMLLFGVLGLLNYAAACPERPKGES